MTSRTRISRSTLARGTAILLALTFLGTSACARRQPPVTKPVPAPALEPVPAPAEPGPVTASPTPVDDLQPVAADAIAEDGIAGKTLDDLNRNSPFTPVFYALDSSTLDEAGRQVVAANARILKNNPSWKITVEGHCDERGTAEYNLSLGELRAVAVRTYLASLGIPPDRVQTVSYGKEFPFERGHDEAAWAKNRRAHFVITSK
jgi:peptidoglycan-associated lipoprotein